MLNIVLTFCPASSFSFTFLSSFPESSQNVFEPFTLAMCKFLFITPWQENKVRHIPREVERRQPLSRISQRDDLPQVLSAFWYKGPGCGQLDSPGLLPLLLYRCIVYSLGPPNFPSRLIPSFPMKYPPNPSPMMRRYLPHFLWFWSVTLWLGS